VIFHSGNRDLSQYIAMLGHHGYLSGAANLVRC
jgi:hypothetical protein